MTGNHQIILRRFEISSVLFSQAMGDVIDFQYVYYEGTVIQETNNLTARITNLSNEKRRDSNTQSIIILLLSAFQWKQK